MPQTTSRPWTVFLIVSCDKKLRVRHVALVTSQWTKTKTVVCGTQCLDRYWHHPKAFSQPQAKSRRQATPTPSLALPKANMQEPALKRSHGNLCLRNRLKLCHAKAPLSRDRLGVGVRFAVAFGVTIRFQGGGRGNGPRPSLRPRRF